MKITKEIEATDEELEGLEMHSIINIMSVITGQIQLIQMESNHPELLDSAISKTLEFEEAIKLKERSKLTKANLTKLEQTVKEALSNHFKVQRELNDGSTLEEYTEIFKKIFDVFEVRLKEIQHRWDNPNRWVPFQVESFIDDFKEFFYALERNSKGRYKIIYNIAEQNEQDYLVNFAINSDVTKYVYMPLILKDVIRDLIANARKYTPPGGKITVGISQKNGTLTFVIEDTGYGIPKNEIKHVVDYGYRASNVRDKVRTMGGGYGLTKAYKIIRELNGNLWINSEINKGTKIHIEIPSEQY